MAGLRSRFCIPMIVETGKMLANDYMHERVGGLRRIEILKHGELLAESFWPEDIDMRDWFMHGIETGKWYHKDINPKARKG